MNYSIMSPYQCSVQGRGAWVKCRAVVDLEVYSMYKNVMNDGLNKAKNEGLYIHLTFGITIVIGHSMQSVAVTMSVPPGRVWARYG